MPEPALVPGVVEEVAPHVRRLIAPNPGVMTGPGTNTYLVGDEVLAVIDPGPEDDSHLEATLAAVADLGARLDCILVTHTHLDHSPGAAALAQRTRAERLGFTSRDGFEASRTLVDGDEVDLGPIRLRAVHTPGHASNHLCYLTVPDGDESGGTLLFSGDHIMGGSTVVISPPDGDMTQYLSSLDRLLGFDPEIDAIAPGHGPMLHDPRAVIEGYLAHRRVREAFVAAALAAAGTATVDDLVCEVYADVEPERHPIARKSLWAHLRKLRSDGLAASDAPDDIDASWRWLTP